MTFKAGLALTYLRSGEPGKRHLTTGVAFAFPWHRDTWYSALRARQINWWLPIFPVRDDNAMSFDPGQLRPGGPQYLGQLRLLPEQRQPTHHVDQGDPG
jgi:hypothetical protein